jgi:hypothetical protein
MFPSDIIYLLFFVSGYDVYITRILFFVEASICQEATPLKQTAVYRPAGME